MRLKFEWDTNKEKRVFLERGISFADAARVFNDDNLILWQSIQQEKHEERFIAVGIVDERYLATVFTFREDAIRIITVRPARRKEREDYEQRKLD